MRFFIIIPVILLSFELSAQNVKVSDYKVPVSEARNLRLTGNWDWTQDGDTVLSNNANGTLVFRQFYASLPLAWSFDVDADGSRTLKRDTTSTFIYNHNINVRASFRKYIWDNADWFGTTTINAQHQNVYQQVKSDLSIGYGYGRYINATALAKSVRIEGHLLEDKILEENLPGETLIAIANIIEREGEYKIIYGDTYETYWFNDIEREIKKAGFEYEVGKTALAVLRMRQVLFGINERVNDRYYGWLLSAGFLQPLSTEKRSTKVGNPNLKFDGRYSYPISWELQLNTTLEVFTPIDSSFFKKVETRAGVDFIYELGSRINFVAGYRFSMDKPIEGEVSKSHNLNASFWYYLENNIYLTVNSSLSKQGDQPTLLKSSMGLQYNLF